MYKPVPDFYTKILEKTGWKYEETLFVGDNLVDDVKGPKSVGMRSALIDRKGRYSNNSGIKPDFVFNSLKELKSIIK